MTSQWEDISSDFFSKLRSLQEWMVFCEFAERRLRGVFLGTQNAHSRGTIKAVRTKPQSLYPTHPPQGSGGRPIDPKLKGRLETVDSFTVTWRGNGNCVGGKAVSNSIH